MIKIASGETYTRYTDDTAILPFVVDAVYQVYAHTHINKVEQCHTAREQQRVEKRERICSRLDAAVGMMNTP